MCVYTMCVYTMCVYTVCIYLSKGEEVAAML